MSWSWPCCFVLVLAHTATKENVPKMTVLPIQVPHSDGSPFIDASNVWHVQRNCSPCSTRQAALYKCLPCNAFNLILKYAEDSCFSSTEILHYIAGRRQDSPRPPVRNVSFPLGHNTQCDINYNELNRGPRTPLRIVGRYHFTKSWIVYSTVYQHGAGTVNVFVLQW